LSRQRASIERDLGSVACATGPTSRPERGRSERQAELARLSAMNVGMGAQVLSARLAALAEAATFG
jgi:hypothetical protein